MKKRFKKYFIPHEENDHAPHFLRPKSVLFVVGIILAAEAMFFVNKALLLNTNLFALVFPDALVAQTNDNRVLEKAAPLTVNDILSRAAQLKANDMATKGYFAHTSPEGVTPWHWFNEAGYKYAYAGENLAVNFSDSSDITNAWLNSPTHRANILNGKFTEVGIATAKGVYKGQETIFVVQMFGNPIKTAIAAVEPSTVPTGEKPVTEEQPLEETEVFAQTQEPELLGEETTATPSEEMFIAVKGAEVEIVSNDKREPSRVIPKTTLISDIVILAEKTVASPRRNTNTLLTFLVALTAAALIFKIFIKIRVQRPKLIFGGVLILLFATAAMVLNQHLTLTSATIL